jgi:RimJ/RimL family protein N-acetyltransferase
MDAEASLETERLHLEPLREADADELFPLLVDQQLHTFTGGRPATREELVSRFRKLETRRSPDGSEEWLNWVVRHRETDAAVGTVQATIIGDRALVAWVIATRCQGRGFATEGATALVSWLSADTSIATVSAHIASGHLASERVAERAGLALTDEMVDGERVWRLQPVYG